MTKLSSSYQVLKLSNIKSLKTRRLEFITQFKKKPIGVGSLNIGSVKVKPGRLGQEQEEILFLASNQFRFGPRDI